MKEQIKAVILATAAVAEAIRTLKQVPNGVLYAQVMSTGISFEDYTAIIETLKRVGVVREANHLLIWIGKEPTNVVCAWCSTPLKPKAGLPPGQVSHGICPACARAMRDSDAHGGAGYMGYTMPSREVGV